MPSVCETSLPARDYDLHATMTSGQVFAWERIADDWVGIVNGRWVKLRQAADTIHASTTQPQDEWSWLVRFLQSELDLQKVLDTFPNADPHLGAAVDACHGLRLLRQDPWECLASFILSSTKQIVQIQQIVRTLGKRFGERVTVPVGLPPAFAFPTVQRVAALTEGELRQCKMGFRAPYLLGTARRILAGEFDPEQLRQLPEAEARASLMALPGVGAKIADCVLLFAYGFPTAFPVDVWINRALSTFYFRGRRIKPDKLRRFASRHFGPNAGYAQQYLFHHIRTQPG
jgi:N-glycosylase/DNA lyase